jgi:vacuolar iron transporter family protein
VLPYLFGGGTVAVVVSGVLSALALMLVGGALALFTGRSPLVSAVRMVVIGAAASAITFLVGRVIGVSVEG